MTVNGTSFAMLIRNEEGMQIYPPVCMIHNLSDTRNVNTRRIYEGNNSAFGSRKDSPRALTLSIALSESEAIQPRYFLFRC